MRLWHLSPPLTTSKQKLSDERKLLRHYSLRDPATILMNALRSVGTKKFLKGPMNSTKELKSWRSC